MAVCILRIHQSALYEAQSCLIALVLPGFYHFPPLQSVFAFLRFQLFHFLHCYLGRRLWGEKCLCLFWKHIAFLALEIQPSGSMHSIAKARPTRMDGVICSATTVSIYLQCLHIYFIMVDFRGKKVKVTFSHHH